MRRRTKRRYSLETIILSLLIVPPIGFFLLWITARTKKSRIIVTVAFVVFLAVAAGAFFKLGFYARLKGPEIPASGFDYSHDNRGLYVNPKILPFEWKIFNEVVSEMRHFQNEETPPAAEAASIEMIQPEYKAFDSIATKHDMSVEDVKGIYLKVTTTLSAHAKK